MMTCRDAEALLSPYIDGRVTGTEAQSIRLHLDSCGDCSGHFQSLRRTQVLISGVGRRQPPPEMVLRIRLALERERAIRTMPLRQRVTNFFMPIADRIEDLMRRMVFPATAGLVSAVLCFGFLIGFFALPTELSAANDIPSGLFTPAKLMSSPFTVQDDCGPDRPVMVQAYVGSDGRVEDYRIVSDEPESSLPTLRAQLDNALIFAQFEPAVAFGKRAPSRVVISFARVNVHA
jgi:Putative zinc-finger